MYVIVLNSRICNRKQPAFEIVNFVEKEIILWVSIVSFSYLSSSYVNQNLVLTSGTWVR